MDLVLDPHSSLNTGNMRTRIRQCGLCRANGVELKESHLLPKALFKLVCDRVGGLGSGHVIVTKEKSFYSDTQIKDYFLCGACESKFSINGESYVISQCHRGRGQFERQHS